MGGVIHLEGVIKAVGVQTERDLGGTQCPGQIGGFSAFVDGCVTGFLVLMTETGQGKLTRVTKIRVDPGTGQPVVLQEPLHIFYGKFSGNIGLADLNALQSLDFSCK